MKIGDLEKLPLDDLWELHTRVESILAERVGQEKRKLEQQLQKLGEYGDKRSDTRERRQYPKVPQKFRNPAYPAQTWSGRGKQPRWVKSLIASGATLEDLRISSGDFVQEWLKRASS
jgi:DNA-binding protein H-NS